MTGGRQSLRTFGAKSCWFIVIILGNVLGLVEAATTTGPGPAGSTLKYDLARYVRIMSEPDVDVDSEQTSGPNKGIEGGGASADSITFDQSEKGEGVSSKFSLVLTTISLIDESAEYPCSVLSEYGSFNFKYKYTPQQLNALICRCRNLCKKFVVPKHVKEKTLDHGYNPMSYKNKPRFIGVVCAFSILLLIGLVGNITTIVGLLRWVKHTSPTFAFIISLSCSDLLLLCVCMPLKVMEYFHLGDAFTEGTCKLSYFLRDFTLICSVLTLTVISFERYYAICHPLVVQYRCTWIRARNIILVTWALSLCLATPTVFMTQYYLPAGMNRKACLQQSKEDLHLQLYFIYFLGILFVLPVMIMTFTYGRSCYVLWKSTQISSQLQSKDQIHRKFQSKTKYQRPKPKESDDHQTRRKVIRILVLIVCLFIFCWGPPLIVQLLSTTTVIMRANTEDIRLAMEALTYVSSALDPYLFMAMSSFIWSAIDMRQDAAMSSQFRHAALRCLRCVTRRRNLGYTSTYKDSAMSMHTVTDSGMCFSDNEQEYNL